MSKKLFMLVIAALILATVSQPALAAMPEDGTCTYKATFLADVTFPDDTVVEPGTQFLKTWRVRNDGTCTWGAGGYALHTLKFSSGDKLAAVSPVEISGTVKPGNTVDLSVKMTAPSAKGTYVSRWLFAVDNGSFLGVGPDGKMPLYVRIIAATIPTPTRISFDKGATSAAISGSLKGGEVKEFLIYALKGQTMMIVMGSTHSDVSFLIRGKNTNDTLGIIRAPTATWVGSLPASQDYVIEVFGNTKPSQFSFNVTIPSRIQFASGAVSATVNGRTNARRTISYLLHAAAGQTMAVTVNAPNKVVGLTIYGLRDGQPLVRAESGATTWTGKLPATQDYVVNVVPGGDTSINFSLQVTIK